MSTQTFENENIKAVCTQEPNCLIHLTLNISPQATQASYKKAVKSLNKEISIPGFRRGKSPEEMVIQKFGKEIEQEWKKVLVNTSFEEAMHLVKRHPFNSSNSILNVSIKKASLDEGSTIEFKYETAPVIPSINPKDLSLAKVDRHSVTEKEIGYAIHDILTQHAEWIDVNDRGAQEGDYVDLDIDLLSEPARNVCTNRRFLISPDYMEPWMQHLVIGKKAGEVVEGMSEKKEDDCQACAEGEPGHDHTHFKPVLCRIMIHSIKQAKLPELSETVLKTLGATSSEDLKNKVEISLKKRAEEEQKNQQRMLMQQLLLNRYPFDIPTSLMQNEIKAQKKGIIDQLRAQGTEESKIPAEMKIIEEEAFKRLTNHFRLFFLINKIAEENHLEVSKDEIVQEWIHQMWYQQSGQNSVDLSKKTEEVHAQLQVELLARKVLDFLISHAEQKT